MAEIILTDVTKTYRGGGAPVRGASLTVPSGAFCVLTGPSGSGKSTLLRLIASREEVTSGQIEIGDAVHQSYRPGRPEIVELVDPKAIDPGKNLYDTMLSGLTKRGLKRKDAQERTLRAAQALGLGDLLARRPRSLSAGEIARAAIGRAFAHQPRALLFDEPLADLDPQRRFAIRRALKKAQRESGATAIYVTQDQAEAFALADLLAVMHEGSILQAGTPQELYERPANRTVATLLGSPPMNVLPVRANQTGLSLEDGTHLGAASVMTTATFAYFGVRPEHLFAVGSDGEPVGAKLPIDVEDVEGGGPEFYVHGRVGAHPVTARLTTRPEVPADGRLTLGAKREHLHMFDAETGVRL